MNGIRQYVVLFAIVISLTLPAIGALILYKITKDPYLRPLGLTKEEAATVDGPAEAISIGIQVSWGVDQDSLTKDDLRQLISRTLSFRTEAFHFDFDDVHGTEIGVTFVVGPNRYGPFPPNRLIDGIVPALAALEYTQQANQREEPP